MVELAEHERSVEAVCATESDWACMLSRPGAVGYLSAVRTLSLWRGGDILAMDDLFVREASRDRGVRGT